MHPDTQVAPTLTWLSGLPQLLSRVLHSPDMPTPRPVLSDHLESNVPGLYIAGDLAGAPVLKLAMEQGSRVVRRIAAGKRPPAPYDVIIVGAGAAGLSAALEAQALGLRYLVLERDDIAATLVELPEGKWIYAEPREFTPASRLPLEESTKEELVEHWRQTVRQAGLQIRTHCEVESICRRPDGAFEVLAAGQTWVAATVILAIGKNGAPKRLGVPGENSHNVYHRLYQPLQYRDRDIVVIGGGNSAVEAALSLAEHNRVTLVYRGRELFRPSKRNLQKLQEAQQSGKLKVRLQAIVRSLDNGVCDIGSEAIRFDCAFVLIGAQLPAAFLRRCGIRLENEWTWKRYALLALCFVLAYTIYAVKQPPGYEFWPFTGWGAQAFAFFHKPWAFWYSVLYTAAMTVFGWKALKRWGLSRGDRFQTWRYISLIGFQWIFFFLIPEFLFAAALRHGWLGPLADDPAFVQQTWRAYGLVYAWPLFFYAFFGAPAAWVVWGALLSFFILPIVVLFHGKRYCSWVCGCGGLAETVGDRWRHLAPKGEVSIRWERMNLVVLLAACVVTILVLAQDALTFLRRPATAGLHLYHLLADVWLVGIIPVALYPFFGGKIWCRYWCPLAKMMELFSAAYTRLGWSRFAIQANDKCIACGECTRNCQVGIDVMRFALRQENITNANTSCIGCGICITVCPMKVLSFGRPQKPLLIQIQGVR